VDSAELKFKLHACQVLLQCRACQTLYELVKTIQHLLTHKVVRYIDPKAHNQQTGAHCRNAGMTAAGQPTWQNPFPLGGLGGMLSMQKCRTHNSLQITHKQAHDRQTP